MTRIAVVTDSTANIPSRLREGRPIIVVPVHLLLEGRALLDQIDITAGEFYRWFDNHPNAMISTSCPSPGEFLAAYRGALSTAEAIVSIHSASGLSATFASAVQAADLLKERSSPMPVVHVIDSRTVSMACGFCVLAACEAAEQGKDALEVIRAAEAVVSRMNMYAVLGTLRYVARSGRVPAVARAFVAHAPVSPLLRIGSGRVKVTDVLVTRARAVRRMLETVAHEAAGGQVNVSVLHAGAAEEAEELAQALAQRCDCKQVVITEFTPVMGANTGSGLVGVAFYPSEGTR